MEEVPPALEPPEGIMSNFINPPSIHYVHVAVAVSALSVSVVAVAARTFARVKYLKKFDLNDCALILSLALMSAYVGLTINTGRYGQGVHQWNVPLPHFMVLLKFMNILETLYGPLLFLAKYVVLRQIEAIFLQHRFHSFSHTGLAILIWLNLIFYAGLTLSIILACIPRSKIWDRSVKGQCIDVNAALIASGAINILSDIGILILPLIAIRNLQASRKTKIKVGAIFAVGSFAIIASIVRFVYTVGLTKTEDLTYWIEPFAYWTEIEFATIVLVACFPSFPVLFRSLRQESKRRWFSSNKSGSWFTGSKPQADERPEHSSVKSLRGHEGNEGHELEDRNSISMV
ncbi:hypothetical protein F5Y10DRAFT_258691 [Nemania abortiva]|nr:hypothetical protein F5Y10DRAFT_258691 [Nemania abortiva]